MIFFDINVVPFDDVRISTKMRPARHTIETLGLGSGTTSHIFVRALGERVRAGLRIAATITSKSTTAIAQEAGIVITDCHCGGIENAPGLEVALNMVPGVVENGLFTRESDGMVVDRFDGTSYVALREA